MVKKVSALKSDSRCDIQEQSSVLEEWNQIQEHSRVCISPWEETMLLPRFYSGNYFWTEKG